jgi:hypothetical protein
MATVDPFSDAVHATPARKIGTKDDYDRWHDTLKKTDLQKTITSVTGSTYTAIRAVQGEGMTNPVKFALRAHIESALFPANIRLGISRMNPHCPSEVGALRSGTAAEKSFMVCNARVCALLQQLEPTFDGTNCLAAWQQFEDSIGFGTKAQYLYTRACLDGRPVLESDGLIRNLDMTGFRPPERVNFMDKTGANAVADLGDYETYYRSIINRYEGLRKTLKPDGESALKGIDSFTEAETKQYTAKILHKVIPYPVYVSGPNWKPALDGTMEEYWTSMRQLATDNTTGSNGNQRYLLYLQGQGVDHGGGGAAGSTKTGEHVFAVPLTQGAKPEQCGEYELGLDGCYHLRRDPKKKLSKKANVLADGWYCQQKTKNPPFKYNCPGCETKGKPSNHMPGWTHCFTNGPTKRGSEKDSRQSGRDRQPHKKSRFDKSKEVCRNFRDFQTCKYGDSCSFKHVSAPLTTSAIRAEVRAELAAERKCVCPHKDVKGHKRTECPAYAAMMTAAGHQ